MNTKNKIFLILFLVFSVASFSFGASSQQAVFVPNSNLAPSPYNGQIKISGDDQLNNSPLQDQFLNFTLNVQPLTPLTLNLSTDKSQYQVGESAKYTISGTALPQNPSNYQTITAVIYAVAYPPGRGGCANGCNVTFTYLNGSWSVYGNQFTSSDVGNWTVRVTYNNTQSNDVSYSVLSSSPPPPPPSSTPTANLTINGVTSGSFRVGDSWTLRITSNLPNKEVTICTEPPSPTGYSCTPAVNLGFSRYTDSNGNWTANGTFGSNSVGTWKEYAKVDTTNSNYINFTVSTTTQPLPPPPPPPPIQSQPTLKVVPSSLSLNIGQGYQLRAYYDPDGPTGPQSESEVTNISNWFSSNSSVVTVGNSASWPTNKGYVNSISQGQAIITATYNNLSAQATVNVLSETPTPSSGVFNLQATDQPPTVLQRQWYEAISTTINPGQTKSIYARYLVPFIGPYTYWLWCNESSISTNPQTISQRPNFSGTSYSPTNNQYQEYALWCNYTNAGNYSMKMIVRNNGTNEFYQDIVPITITTAGNGGKYRLTVEKSGTGSGTVTSNPAGINCGQDCQEDYNLGTLVTLTATPQQGSNFVRWEGDCSGTSPTCQLTMNKNKNVIAVFSSSQQPPPPPPPPSSQTHLECNSSNQCVSVQGSGGNRCSTDSGCGKDGAQFKGVCEYQKIGNYEAYYCVNKACQPNEDCTSSCKTDADCQNPTSPSHLECYNNACVIVSGPGQNKCGTIGPGCRRIREIIPFNPPSLNQFIKQTAVMIFSLKIK